MVKLSSLILSTSLFVRFLDPFRSFGPSAPNALLDADEPHTSRCKSGNSAEQETQREGNSRRIRRGSGGFSDDVALATALDVFSTPFSEVFEDKPEDGRPLLSLPSFEFFRCRRPNIDFTELPNEEGLLCGEDDLSERLEPLRLLSADREDATLDWCPPLLGEALGDEGGVEDMADSGWTLRWFVADGGRFPSPEVFRMSFPLFETSTVFMDPDMATLSCGSTRGIIAREGDAGEGWNAFRLDSSCDRATL